MSYSRSRENKRRSPIAKDLQSRQYQPKAIPNKKRNNQKHEEDYSLDDDDTVSALCGEFGRTDPA